MYEKVNNHENKKHKMNTILEQIKKLIETYFSMMDGEPVDEYLHEILFFGYDIEIRITYRALKHIVEQRKKDTYSRQDISQIFEILISSLNTNNYQIFKDISVHNRFIFTENYFSNKDSILLILEITPVKNKVYYIKTGFFRLVNKIKKFIKNKTAYH